jgi:hypothetical protein
MENTVPRVNDLLTQPQQVYDYDQPQQVERPQKKRRTNKGNEVSLRNIRTDPNPDELDVIGYGVDSQCYQPDVGKVFTDIAKSLLSVGLTVAFGALFKSFLCVDVNAKSINNNGSTSTTGKEVSKRSTDNTLFGQQSIFNEPI